MSQQGRQRLLEEDRDVLGGEALDGDAIGAHTAEVLGGRAGGLGLVNVDRRLRTVFGPGYGLVVETAPDLALPKMHGDQFIATAKPPVK